MFVDRIELRLLNLPLVEPFVAAHGAMTIREIVVVRIETDQGYGWGECSALPDPTYTDEFAEGAFLILEDELAPRLVSHRLMATAVADRLSVVGGNPMAKAALEMALCDAELRLSGHSLAERIGAATSQVAAGATVGLGALADVVERAEALEAEGFGRVKLKIKPGHDLEVVAAVRSQTPSLEIQVDGNGAYSHEHLALLVELASSGVSAIEQPFSPIQLSSVQALVEQSPVPIVADEAADSIRTVELLKQEGALSGVSIKPSRLGGIEAACRMHELCVDLGLAVTAGGMIETGLGRHALAAVAALDGFTLTGDLSPARRWLAADPWPDLTMTAGMIEVPAGPGIAPEPDPELLDRYSVRHSMVKA